MAEAAAAFWGEFAGRGPLRPGFRDAIRGIPAEWIPAAGAWERAGAAEIERYPGGDAGSPGYRREYRVPLRAAGTGR